MSRFETPERRPPGRRPPGRRPPERRPPDIYEPAPEGRGSIGQGPVAGEELGISSEAWRSVAVGAVIGLVAYSIPFTRFVFGYLGVLIHELGHAAVAWLFGYPAVPAFDFRYGGGVTPNWERSTPLMLLLFVAFGYLFYLLRDHPGPRNLAAGATAFYLLLAFTPAHEVLQLAMGHGTELVFAGIFFYRAFSGAAVVHGVERPLYAACAVLLLLMNLSLAWGLMTDVDARTAYGMAKGGGHVMDLSRIARDYLGLSLPEVASFLFVGCLLPGPVAFLLARRRAAE